MFMSVIKMSYRVFFGFPEFFFLSRWINGGPEAFTASPGQISEHGLNHEG